MKDFETLLSCVRDPALRERVKEAETDLLALLAERGWPADIAEELRDLHFAPLVEAQPMDLMHPGIPAPFPADQVDEDGEPWFMEEIALLDAGFLPLGSGPNGDFVALDCRGEQRSVLLFPLGDFHAAAEQNRLAETARVAAEDFSEYLAGLHFGTVPVDYEDAG